jgi:hypothetical protein
VRRALVMLVVLLTPACSIRGESGADERQGYLRQAEAICTRANEAQAAEQTPTDAQSIAAYVRRLVTIAGDAGAELAALEPPEADAAELDAKLVRPLQEQLQLARDYASTVEQTAAGGDAAAVLTLLGSAPTQVKVDLAYLREYGFTACLDAVDAGR